MRLDEASSTGAVPRASLAPALDAMERAERSLLAPCDTVVEEADLATRVQALENAVLSRDEFISVVSHELRNPLSPLFLQLRQLIDVAQQTPAAVTAEWLVPRLEIFGRRLDRLLVSLNRLLDVSRLRSGRVSLEYSDVDLVEVVQEAAAALEGERQASRSSLSLSLPPGASGRWDRMRLEQIVTNLLSNAIRYGAGAPIEVRLSLHDDDVELVVEDHGVGIPPEEQPKVFDRFERANGTRQAGGFGVGLWLVRKLCTAMGGSVRVDSRLGERTIFTVTLPRGRGAA